MPHILIALQIAQAAGAVVSDVLAAIRTAQSEGRDLTDAEMAALTHKKQSADALAEAEAKRLREKFGIAE